MAADLHLDLRRRRGTLLRFLRGNVVGLLTAGFVEDDTAEPERFEVVIRAAPGGKVLGRVAAGSSPWDAEAFLQLLHARMQELERDDFLRQYTG